MHNSDHQHRFRAVVPRLVVGTRNVMIMPITLHFPLQPAYRPRHKVKAAPGRGPSGEDRPQHIHSEDQQRKPNQSLGDAINAMRQRKLKHDYRSPQHRDHGRVSDRVEQAQSHPTPAIRLHTGDVGDGRDMVVVEAVAESKDRRGQERKLKAVRCAGHG